MSVVEGCPPLVLACATRPMDLCNVVYLSQARLFALYFFAKSGVEGFYAKLSKTQFGPLSSIVLLAGLSADSVMNSSKASRGLQ